MPAPPPRVILFGNSGAGKSTLAARLCREGQLAHLDLDLLAWEPTAPPTRRALASSENDIDDFIGAHDGWVIEGCYADLLSIAGSAADTAIWLNLPVAECIANARARPWEPHKYSSPEAQDANLPMLIDWIGAYETRADTFSRSTHQALFAGFQGRRLELNRRREADELTL